MSVNRFVLNAISYHGKGAIKEIPGLVAAKGFNTMKKFRKYNII